MEHHISNVFDQIAIVGWVQKMERFNKRKGLAKGEMNQDDSGGKTTKCSLFKFADKKFVISS